MLKSAVRIPDDHQVVGEDVEDDFALLGIMNAGGEGETEAALILYPG